MIIRTNVGMMPGGIIYTDPRVPAMKWMDDHTFLEERVQEVIKFRKANPKVYPDTEPQYLDPVYVANEITVYNCTRLGNNPAWCLEDNYMTAGKPIPASRTAANLCTCGHPLSPRYCPTCSGQRLIGYECKSCGKQYDL